MLKPRALLLCLFILAGSAALPARAQNASPPTAAPVESTLSVFQVRKNAEGKEVLSAADKAAPGEVLEYQNLYRNNGKSALKSLTATLPLPAGLGYVAGSAQPANPQASLDGKTFADIPLKTMVKGADGKLQPQLVPYSDYRALRWTIGELPSNEKVTVSARAQVSPVLVTPPASAPTATR